MDRSPVPREWASCWWVVSRAESFMQSLTSWICVWLYCWRESECTDVPRDQCAHYYRAAIKKVATGWRYTIWILALALCVAAGYVLCMRNHPSQLRIWSIPLLAVPSIVFLHVVSLVIFFRTPVQRAFREILNQNGRRVCLHCGYDLRGQVNPRCPECGSRCELTAERKLANRHISK